MSKNLLKIPVENTRTHILEILLSEETTALALAERLAINESAVRRHLDVLENSGLVEHEFKKVPMGRPKKSYKLSARGKGVFPDKSGFMVRFLSQELNKRLDKEEMRGLAGSLAEVIGERISDSGELKDSDEILSHVVKVSNDIGLYSTLEREDDHFVITYRNCVFREVSPEFARWMCSAHRKVIKDILGDASVEQVKSILSGDLNCKQKIELKDGI